MKLTTYCGSPSKFLRSSGFWVAMPAGQVSRWQTRIMTQPRVTSGPVAKPNSSAPSRAAMTTSRPVLSWPSVSTTIRLRRLFKHQRLVGFGHAQFPGQAGMFDAADRRSARPAIVAADQHHIGMGLGDARRDGAHAHFRNQLDVDPGLRVGILQVVDQFGQVFDRINIVMRRRRNQSHAGGRVAHLGNPRVNLAARQLAAFAGLGALRHLDLDFLGIDQVLAGHAKARRSHLFDGAVARIAVWQRTVSAPGLRRLRRCCSCRRCGSSRSPAPRALPG